jgi:hypothetical protein
MKKMPFVFSIILVWSLGACSPNAMLLVDPMVALDLMSGQGSVSRTQNGQTNFRFVIPSNAYVGLIDDPRQLRQQHNLMLSQWVGKQGICPKGYSVGEPQEVQGMVVYEGACT